MKGFFLKTPEGQKIRFEYYLQAAPISCQAFAGILPFSRVFFHAKVSGQEIWIDRIPPLDTIQENASVFTQPGEAVFGPAKPSRAKTANCFGIYYGEGKGLDACNIFAKVIPEDFEVLQKLGDDVWRNGAQELILENWY